MKYPSLVFLVPIAILLIGVLIVIREQLLAISGWLFVALVVFLIAGFLYGLYWFYSQFHKLYHGNALRQLEIDERRQFIELQAETWHFEHRNQIVLPAIEASTEPLLLAAPVAEQGELLSFRELLQSGQVQRAIAKGQLLLGYQAETGTLRYGSWLDLYSAGNGGVSGSGKSTTTRFLLFQAILANAKLLMIDPHLGDPEESLAHQFSLLPASIHQMPPCNARAEQVFKRVRWLSKELERRQNIGRKLPVLLFVVDEFNSLMRRFSKEERNELVKLLLDIEQEGRKFGVFALLIGQRWSAQDLGGADIRSSLASKLAHRFSDEDQAKRFMGSKYGKQLLELETGHFLFYDTKGKTAEMVTPATYAEDGALVARIIEGEGVTSTNDFATSESTSTEEDFEAEEAVTSRPVKPLDARSEQVLSMLKKQAGQNEIIEQVWGLKSSDGRPYRAAVEEYRVILASLVSR